METAEPKSKLTSSTLFPKIGKLSDFIYRFQRTSPNTREIPLVGTVKLHGAHADWVVSSDDTVRIQSRNVLEISASKDIYGLFAFTTPIHDVIIRLRDDLLGRFSELHPHEAINPDYPVIMAGEWCGQGIQKGVAISKLLKHFVIIAIRINGEWVNELDYADICNEARGIYNIGKATSYRFDFDLDDAEFSELDIQRMVEDVGDTCPYGLARGVQGPGEGIVWKAIGYQQDPELWFKYKAEPHAVSKSSKLPAAADGMDSIERENDFIEAVMTEGRLQQGLEYLREMDVAEDKAAAGKFVTWIVDDIFTEEAGEMKRIGIRPGKVRPWIMSRAGSWYKKTLIRKSGDKSAVEAITEGIWTLATSD
ncbi:MAG: hypothetical protein Q9170_001889 [Blastenia crenularia]